MYFGFKSSSKLSNKMSFFNISKNHNQIHADVVPSTNEDLVRDIQEIYPRFSYGKEFNRTDFSFIFH